MMYLYIKKPFLNDVLIVGVLFHGAFLLLVLVLLHQE